MNEIVSYDEFRLIREAKEDFIKIPNNFKFTSGFFKLIDPISVLLLLVVKDKIILGSMRYDDFKSTLLDTVIHSNSHFIDNNFGIIEVREKDSIVTAFDITDAYDKLSQWKYNYEYTIDEKSYIVFGSNISLKQHGMMIDFSDNDKAEELYNKLNAVVTTTYTDIIKKKIK